MEVLVGSTFTIEVSSPPSQRRAPPPSRLFVEGSGDEDYPSPDEEVSSESSSSIGTPDESEEDENDVVTSKPRLGLGFGSFDSLEESLPVKRGLSNHYSGKSKSFGNLSDVKNTVNAIKEVEKPENPFNKRRRLLLANKLQRKCFYNWRNPKSMPVLNTLVEDEEDEDNPDQEENPQENQHKYGSNSMLPPKGPRVMDVRFKASFKSYSCLSLADLQEEHDEDDDD